MPLTITFTNDAFPPGTEFSVEGLGVVKNGEPTELTEDQERTFASINRVTVQDAFADSESHQVEGSPTVNSVDEALNYTAPTPEKPKEMDFGEQNQISEANTTTEANVTKVEGGE